MKSEQTNNGGEQNRASQQAGVSSGEMGRPHERRQQYFIVMAERGSTQPPLAMFQYREWAEEWKARYCATGVIEDYDMKLRS